MHKGEPMHSSELYQFDLNGYLVIEDAIDSTILDEIEPVVDQWQQRAEVPINESQAKIEGIVANDERFLNITMSPKVLARITNLIQFPRLKSTWLDFKSKGSSIGFHSNHTPYDPVDAYYWQNNIYANLVTVCYALCDIPIGGAALEVIPGSHKANYPLPEDTKLLSSLRKELPLKKGSALIFTHDMNHGSYNSLNYTRRCLFTSFSTGSSSNTQGENNLYYDLFKKQEEGSWRKYLLREPKGDRDTYPQPTHSIEDETTLCEMATDR
ncbi:MAG: hypothetical protein COA79_24185 [Planctomycetota bacterium]|nr:MAG: hypothetical protein COA79_24185 [Planctomycetota bacterium]